MSGSPVRPLYDVHQIRTPFLAVILLSAAIGYGIRSWNPGAPVDERALLADVAADRQFGPKTGAPPVSRADDGSVAFNTFDIAPRIRGYAGPIKVLLVLDRSGKITGLRIIEHRETKNYVHYLETPAYLAQFIGKSAADLFEPDRDIDSITRATVSVKALADSVRESSRIVAFNVLGMPVSMPASAARSDVQWLWYAALFGAALGGYALTQSSARFLRWRDATLACGIAVVGLYLSSPFSILHVLNLLLLRPSSSLLWYALVFSTILSVLFAGRFYCGWICPFGALSEFIGRLPFRKWDIPPDTDSRWRMLKYGLLGLATAVVLVSGRVDYGNFETYVTLFSFHGTLLAWLLVAVSLVASIRVERFWCRYLCPVAALMGLLSREATGYPSRSDCPMANRPGPPQSECIRCNRCRTMAPAQEARSHA